MRTIWIYVAAAAAIVSGCDSQEAVSTTDPATTVPVTSTTPETTVSATTAPTTVAETTMPPTTAVAASADATAPSPDTTAPTQPTDEEFVEIINVLLERNLAMWADPPNADVLSVCIERSACATNAQDGLDDFVARGLRVVDQPVETVASIENVRDFGADMGLDAGYVYEVTYATVDVRDDFGQVVDADGNVQFNLTPGDEYPVASRKITRGPSDEAFVWRFAD